MKTKIHKPLYNYSSLVKSIQKRDKMDRQHILNTLKKVKQSLDKEDYIEIKQLSDNIIHDSSTEQDPDIISVAIIIYSLSKLIERESYKTEKNWKTFYKNYLKNINDMIESLEKDNLKRFRDEVDANRKLIEQLSGNLKIYINEVFRKAKINKASRIYEHGISMEKTAAILGISVWELAEYAGKTRISDHNLGITMPIKSRIKLAQEIFR